VSRIDGDDKPGHTKNATHRLPGRVRRRVPNQAKQTTESSQEIDATIRSKQQIMTYRFSNSASCVADFRIAKPSITFAADDAEEAPEVLQSIERVSSTTPVVFENRCLLKNCSESLAESRYVELDVSFFASRLERLGFIIILDKNGDSEVFLKGLQKVCPAIYGIRSSDGYLQYNLTRMLMSKCRYRWRRIAMHVSQASVVIPKNC
jgi:hypothetical protein